MTSKLVHTVALATMVALLAVPVAGAQKPLTGTEAEIAAIMARGDALNRLHGLGAYSHSTKAEVRALMLRGAALNQLYGLGSYRVASPSFEWRDAGIGSAATLGALLLGLAAALTFRRRRRAPSQLPDTFAEASAVVGARARLTTPRLFRVHATAQATERRAGRDAEPSRSLRARECARNSFDAFRNGCERSRWRASALSRPPT